MKRDERWQHEEVSSSGGEPEGVGAEGSTESDSGDEDEPAPSEVPSLYPYSPIQSRQDTSGSMILQLQDSRLREQTNV